MIYNLTNPCLSSHTENKKPGPRRDVRTPLYRLMSKVDQLGVPSVTERTKKMPGKQNSKRTGSAGSCLEFLHTGG